MSLSGEYVALDSTSVVTALSGLLVAMIAAAVAVWQSQRVRSLEREKIRLQSAAELQLKEREWDHERQLTERERRRLAREAEQEQERAAERVAARRSTLEAGAAAYCARLVQELSTLRILDMSRPLRLDRLYVQVGVQEQQPLRFLSEDEVERQSRRTDAERRTRRNEADRAEARALAEAQAVVHTYAPVDALQRYRRIVVVGDPGAGKTTMLRHLALRMATQGEDESLPVLPAYVELFRFVESGHESLLDHLAEQWAEQYGFEDARDYIVEKLADGSAALLLDGLDEVLGGESAREAESAYHRVTAELARLATRFPRAPMATTCRRQGWRGGLPQFQVLEALDFEWPQIETFVSNWFGTADRRRAGLVRALSGNGRLQTLAANPLLLSLIAIVYERDLELPERRAALYQRCVEVLLREWDAHRKITRYSRFTTDRKQDLLKEIARHYHRRGLRYFPEDDLLDQIARFLPTIDLAPEDSRAILDEIAAQYGLLKPQAHGWYGFLHLTLQEHFTAAALLERGADGIRQAVGARYDPWWEEVILLLAGSLPDATPLLAGLLQLEPDRPRTDEAGLLDLPDDDFFHTDLLLAARCLTGSPRVADVALRRQIVATVWDLLGSSRYPDEKRRAAAALIGVARSDEQLDEVIAYICDGQRDTEARLALVQALEVHGGRRVGERLLGVFALGGLGAPLREALISALGTLRVEAAVPVLRAELARKLSVLAGEPARDNWSAAKDIALIVRALGRAGAPAEVFLRALELRVGSPWFQTITAAVRDALKNTREPETAGRLLDLLLRPLDDEDLAGAYLDAAGEAGVRTLLDRFRSLGSGAALLTAVRNHITEGHGRAPRDALLALARDRTLTVQARCLALECLDESPGAPDELAEFADHPDTNLRVAAAATLAAWGVPTGLDVIRTAIVNGDVVLLDRWTSEEEADEAVSAPHRLVAVLVPYGVSGIVEELRVKAGMPDPEGVKARDWLYAFSPEDEVDHCLGRLGNGLHLARHTIPDRVPPSRVQAVFQYFQGTPSAGFGVLRRDYEKLLTVAAAAAEGPDSVAWLVRFLPGGDLGSMYFPQAHHHAYEASRRARVRVLRDGTVRPIAVRRDDPAASSVPPPPG
ncbi:NACHT domain-containing protein [Streptomyces pseudovenezuelae]|uniref:NACHT domain-containing protein n=1 Tax=Streptomyces pseudovenezuelae TaxID=67350 RepID=UPI002E305C4B|nr:NACHT domain-containing protein [Streptomyces pseudovenezuelae]WUA89078.1 NACHT domain-containing protein [Streptomyces pseudovenezuelae]